jgi:EmrB/QacA subfamily drug resistance transporter
MLPGRQRQLLTMSLLLAMAVVALEGTVVTTAMPSVVGELQGLTLYPWVFSIYLLASTTTVPIYGKLADIYGRKPVFVVGLTLFLGGTVLCGAAQSMVQLVAFRAVQGLGAGAVLPITLTVLADIYTLEDRAKVQPLTASVWGVLSLIGPAAGAFITVTLSWRWVFWIIVPVGVLALLLIAVFLKERVQRREVTVDYAGALTLTLALLALLLAALQGGQAYPWLSWQILGLLAASVAFLALFATVERRAADPVLPFAAFRLRQVAVSNAGNLLFGVCMYGLTSYVPLFVQAVRGEPATSAGAVLTPMMVGWSITALLSGRLYVRVGFRPTALLGTGLIVLGIAPLTLVGPETPLLLMMVGMGIAGIGFGNASTAFLLAPQSAVPWQLRGAVTASTQFARTIGGSVGVALLGAWLNARLERAFNELPPAVTATAAAGSGAGPDAVVSAMLTGSRALLPPEVVQVLSLALAGGLRWIYVTLLVVAALSFLQVSMFGRIRKKAPPEPAEVVPERSLEAAR